jgi:hypothetical protein
MAVAVHEAGQHRFTVEVNDHRVAALKSKYLVAGPHRQDESVRTASACAMLFPESTVMIFPFT